MFQQSMSTNYSLYFSTMSCSSLSTTNSYTMTSLFHHHCALAIRARLLQTLPTIRASTAAAIQNRKDLLCCSN